MPTNKAMIKMIEDKEDPFSSTATETKNVSDSEAKDISNKGNGHSAHIHDSRSGILSWIKGNFKGRQDVTLRETIEEFIEESGYGEDDDNPATFHEKLLIANVLKLRDTPAVDVMIPRIDIVAVDACISGADLLSKLADIQYSRVPVYKEKLDDVLGTIHIKDVLAMLSKRQDLVIDELIREVPIIAPSMNILDLLLEMRQSRKHMAMVVDEFGGIDGLVTIGDIIEEIVGHLEDEHDTDTQPSIMKADDGSIIADGRYDVDEFEEEYGKLLTDEEREDNDTLGGLAFYMAGRVPVRGEILTHSSGMMLEILDADPRRVSSIKITNIPPIDERE